MVESFGVRPVTSAIAAAARSVNGAGLGDEHIGVRRFPVERMRIRPLAASRARCSISAFSEAWLWRSLKRMLKLARASPGTRLTAVLPTSTVVNSRLDGSNCALPWSSGSPAARRSSSKSADRIVEAMRIGDVALHAVDMSVPIERAAAAGLDGVAESLLIARLAEDAMVEFLAALGRPLQQLDGAVDGDALPRRR